MEWSEDEIRDARIAKIRGDGQFGHAGRHNGTGAPDCPRALHHHHDIFCPAPSELEKYIAGVPRDWQPRSRA